MEDNGSTRKKGTGGQSEMIRALRARYGSSGKVLV
jgi:hypothetical protein